MPVCGNVKNHSINNFEPNFDSIKHRARANGDQPASIETEKFDDAAVNWSSETSHKSFVLRAKEMAPSHQNNLRGTRFAWIEKLFAH